MKLPLHKNLSLGDWYVEEAGGHLITLPTNEKDAEFICLAVNCHGELIEVLKNFLDSEFLEALSHYYNKEDEDTYIAPLRDVLEKTNVE